MLCWACWPIVGGNLCSLQYGMLHCCYRDQNDTNPGIMSYDAVDVKDR